jgi:ribosomal protein S18
LKKKSYYCIIILIFTLCFLILKKYSNHRLQIKDLSSEHLASEILFQRSFYRGNILNKIEKILKGDIDFSNFKKLRNYIQEEQKIKKSLILNKLKKISLKIFLKKKDDPLWAFYLYKKKVFTFEEEKNFKYLQHFFFLKIETHPFQYNFIRKFAQMTSDHYETPQDLDHHVDSRNKNEVLYSFHIIKLKNQSVFKNYFQKNLSVFENFIKIKDSKTIIP